MDGSTVNKWSPRRGPPIRNDGTDSGNVKEAALRGASAAHHTVEVALHGHPSIEGFVKPSLVLEFRHTRNGFFFSLLSWRGILAIEALGDSMDGGAPIRAVFAR